MKLREYAEQKLEALGLEPRQEFELDDGSTIELVHPWLWDDSVQAAFDKAESTADRAKAILGVKDHKRLIAGGGSSNQIILAVELMKRPSTDKVEDDADPKDKSS